MRVFVAGATGALGKQLVPRLVAAGHHVTGMTRSESKRAMLYDLGAVPVVADGLNPDQVADVVGKAEPDVIVHQLTARSTVRIHRWRRAQSSLSLSAGASSRSSATAEVCGRSSTRRRGRGDCGGDRARQPRRLQISRR